MKWFDEGYIDSVSGQSALVRRTGDNDTSIVRPRLKFAERTPKALACIHCWAGYLHSDDLHQERMKS